VREALDLAIGVSFPYPQMAYQRLPALDSQQFRAFRTDGFPELRIGKRMGSIALRFCYSRPRRM
jgi:hypothetical protein